MYSPRDDAQNTETGMFLVADSVMLKPNTLTWRRLASRRAMVGEIEKLHRHDDISNIDILFPDNVRVRAVPLSDIVVVE